jgi:endonuclease/exonuclease/phosphatase family metal-dependent hydrolase
MTRWIRGAPACALMLSLVLVPTASAEATQRKKPIDVTVMTRNVYLGGDISKPIGKAGDEFVRANTEVWDTVRETRFPARAPLLAREIRRTKPDLIGLQEVALWRRGPDGVNDGTATRARTVVYDFLRILQRRLRQAGMRYRVGAVQREADVEGPTSYGYDVRLTMRDAVLVRKRRGLRVRRGFGDNFTARFPVTTPAGTYEVVRGWAAVDASFRGRRFRFVNTHLEAFLGPVRQAQASELVAPGGPANHERPVILVGDFNSDPTGADMGDPVPYGTLTSFGFRDTWTQANPGAPGHSCCMNQENIKDPPPAPFDHRIDHIFTKPRFRVTRTRIVGGDARNRTASGLWPSDHGGHVATLRLGRPR